MKIGMIIGGTVLVVLIILFIIFRKKIKANSNLRSDEITTDKALNEAVKRIYILETANYTSNIFKQTNGAGIIAFAVNYPYGWTMLKNFWDINPDFAPVGKYASQNGNQYLKFPSILAGQKAVAEIIKYRVGRGQSIGAYNSLNETTQREYVRKLLSISIPENDKVRPNKYLGVV